MILNFFDSKSMMSGLSNALSHVPLRLLVRSLHFVYNNLSHPYPTSGFQNCLKIMQKYRFCQKRPKAVKFPMNVFDTVFESLNIILFTSETNGTIVGPLLNTWSTYVTCVIPINYVLWSNFSTVEFFGMSSYDREFCRSKKYEVRAF